MLLLPLQFVDRRRRSPDARRASRRVPGRAGRQLHRPAGDGAVSVATPLRRRLSRRAAERARRSERAARILGLESGRSFSPKVLYVYEKQLEEADLIVINKSDLLSDDAARRRSKRALSARFPQADDRDRQRPDRREPRRLVRPPVRLRSPSRPAMDVDYDVYAEGEALLGWLNATFRLSAPSSVRRQPVPAAAGRRRARPAGRRGHRDRALQDDAGAGHRQRSRGAESRAHRRPIRSRVHRLADELTGGRVDRQPAGRRRSGAAEGDGA